MTYRTTAAYVSGAVCGPMWAGPMAGRLLQADLRSLMRRCGPGATLRDALDLLLMEEGGDFNGASFTADTVVRVERRSVESAGRYTVHVRERELAAIASCVDLTDESALAGDFMGDDD